MLSEAMLVRLTIPIRTSGLLVLLCPLLAPFSQRWWDQMDLSILSAVKMVLFPLGTPWRHTIPKRIAGLPLPICYFPALVWQRCWDRMVASTLSGAILALA